jgi:hypothetical protein
VCWLCKHMVCWLLLLLLLLLHAGGLSLRALQRRLV